MYRSCIFCSADLGTNEVLEAFPVGRSLAFDAWKGRLWVVCRHCLRWNLAPLEERWEAVEGAEKLFRETRLRVQSENIGLAKLSDGTRLIRVGKALPRELAAWRYGDQLVRRRNQALLWGGAGAVATTALVVGGAALGAFAALPVLFHLVVHGGTLAKSIWLLRHQHTVLHRVQPANSSAAEPEAIRVLHMQHAQLVPDPEGEGVALRVPTLQPLERVEQGGIVRWAPPEPWLVRGEDAQRLLARTMTRANVLGARPRQLDRAFAHLAERESRDAFLRILSEREAGLFPISLLSPPGSYQAPLRVPDFRGAWRRFQGSFRGERIAPSMPPMLTRRLAAEEALALEMALHEESERRALEGELAALEAAWREAEEIAQIADALPDDPLDKLRMER